MKLVVAGSRNFENYDFVREHLKKFIEENEVSEIVQGGCRGVDSLAVRFATEFRINVIVFEADWNANGRAAGPIRNSKLAEYGDCFCIFWDMVSRGTKDMLKKATKTGKLIKTYNINGQ